MGEVSSALQAQQSGPEALIEQYKAQLSDVMPGHVRPRVWLIEAYNALRNSDDLRAAALRNPDSLMKALAESARLGHIPGSDHYYLVPFGGEVQGIEGYKGLIDRMYRSGQVGSVHARVVYERDSYSFRPGPNATPDHEPFDGDDPGAMVSVYAYALMCSGAVSEVATLTRRQVESEHREHAKGWQSPKSPWQTQTRKMWLKSAIKELGAWVPLSNEYRPAPPGEGVIDAEIVD